MTHLNSLYQKKIHFIGIGGISMSGLAEIVHKKGFIVTGSDIKESLTTKHLMSLGISVHYGHSPENVADDTELVVYTAAISQDNPELQACIQKGLKLVTRSQFLGLMMKEYNYPICIAGTHGKTTTTSMLSHGLLAADLDPTITVGGILKTLNGNIRTGKSEYFLTEACEYCDSFLDFFPKIGVILNIEEDHLDYFKDIHQIRTSFQKFAASIPSDGFLAINATIDEVKDFIRPLTCQVETFGLDSSADWYADAITFDDEACASFNVYYKGTLMERITLHSPGPHNILNCLSVCSVCHFLGIKLDILNRGLKAFTGANQRFEIKGKFKDVTVVDDYAHHPTEISATLNISKVYPHNELYLVFQPHTYTRTKAFLNEFATVLSDADHVIITDIYAAREKNPGDISAKDIADKIHSLGKEALYMPDFKEVANYLSSHVSSGDLVITMGAGNVNQIADILLNN
ncbi:UDP-N-acetylmuramate--L-alanine ligase [Sporanaerobium hydrogeniformans]|uniref:UDP-N-acetylmuramate--L-alanine ligase n=1 Tax=Sporanaerobium hydrogeniformans TaxID=3072179 RepID=A0AC61DAT7_9FIRM|nr:UDP-N-acetylmuramate--L-alanine ligase [Sporanaerobium hydrogeniformans]PHV70379.1 UDP-N-acetylmuramate--L-alanine ligase [Sporanaerobium hydrogeniformans]